MLLDPTTRNHKVRGRSRNFKRTGEGLLCDCLGVELTEKLKNIDVKSN